MIDFYISSSLDTIKNNCEKNIPLQGDLLQSVNSNLKTALHFIRRAKRDSGLNIEDSLKDSSFEFIYERANNGDPEFQRKLANYYLTEEANFDLAFGWFERSANNLNFPRA